MITQTSEKRKYRMISFLESTSVSHDYLFENFGYHSEFIKPEKSMDIGFSKEKIQNLIEDIINNSEFDLLCVSEDEKSFRYHFITR